MSRVKIAEFADAIGDPNPVYRDRAAARAAGYPDVIAPPTFADRDQPWRAAARRWPTRASA